MSESSNQEVLSCHLVPLYTSTGENSTLSYARGLQQWFDDLITFISD